MNKNEFFSPGQLLVATIFGSLPAGCYLYRHNARLLGKEKEGRQIFMLGISATIGVLVVSIVSTAAWAESLVRAFAYGSMFGPFYASKQSQWKALETHRQEAGSSQGSYTKAVGIGFFSLGGIVIAYVVLALAGRLFL